MPLTLSGSYNGKYVSGYPIIIKSNNSNTLYLSFMYYNATDNKYKTIGNIAMLGVQLQM